MYIAILEFVEDFNDLSGFAGKNGFKLADFKIIALEARLQAYLIKQNVPFENTLNFFDNSSHKKIILETEKVMEYIRGNFNFRDDNRVGNFYKTEFCTFVRFYLNHILKIIEILSNILQRYGKYELYVSVRGKIYESILLDDKESYLGALAELFAKTYNLKFHNINQNELKIVEGNSTKSTSQSSIYKLLNLLLLTILRKKKTIFTHMPGNNFSRIINKCQKRKTGWIFLAIDDTHPACVVLWHNLAAFVKLIFKVGDPAYFIINPKFNSSAVYADEYHRLNEKIENILKSEGENLFRYNNICYYPLLLKKCKSSLAKYFHHMLAYSHGIDFVFKKINRSIVLSSFGIGIISLAGELAKKQNKRSLFISHAAHPVPIDRYHEIELLNLGKLFMLGEYSDVALGTPIQEEHLHYFKKRYPMFQNNEIRTGPLIFARTNVKNKDDIRRNMGIAENEFVLLHATTQKLRCSERFYSVETYDELFKSLQIIINVVDNVEMTKLIIRFHSGFPLRDDEIRTLLPSSGRYTINRIGSFEDALSVSNALISYSSTAIDEALLNNIPVLLFDRWKRYNHFNTTVFQDNSTPGIFPVCYVNDDHKLKYAIEHLRNTCKTKEMNHIDMSRYRYSEDYSENLYAFIESGI